MLVISETKELIASIVILDAQKAAKEVKEIFVIIRKYIRKCSQSNEQEEMVSGLHTVNDLINRLETAPEETMDKLLENSCQHGLQQLKRTWDRWSKKRTSKIGTGRNANTQAFKTRRTVAWNYWSTDILEQKHWSH